MVNYLLVCERKLWLFSRNISQEIQSGLVRLGKLLHERSFTREKKEVLIHGRIKVDHTSRGEKVVIHEVKKSKAKSPAARAQLLFYLYELDELGIECRGELHYYGERRKEAVQLTGETKKEVEDLKEHIVAIVQAEHPPSIPNDAPCRRCAYRDYCWV